jgi:large subunit ribosomal protein L27
MSKKKQGGKLKQQKRTQPKYLGLKVVEGESVRSGSVLVRQRGTKLRAGDGVKTGRDHTLFAIKEGRVKFYKKLSKKYISVI